MKKILFSAIAMVAFSASGFASTEVVEKNEKIEKIIKDDTDCDLIWDLSYNLHRSEGKSVNKSRQEADNAKKNCEDGSGVNGPVTSPGLSIGR